MFSVTKTELNVFPLWTRNVWPTKSGVTIERRAQVLIGFFPPELFILSIFSRRCDSTKGPFFNDLAIKSNCDGHPESRRRCQSDSDGRISQLVFHSSVKSTTGKIIEIPRFAQNDMHFHRSLPLISGTISLAGAPG